MQQRTPVRRLHEHRLCIHCAAAGKRSCVPRGLILAVDQARISCLLHRCGLWWWLWWFPEKNGLQECGVGCMAVCSCACGAW